VEGMDTLTHKNVQVANLGPVKKLCVDTSQKESKKNLKHMESGSAQKSTGDYENSTYLHFAFLFF